MSLCCPKVDRNNRLGSLSDMVEIITEKYLSNEKVQCKIGRKACYIITN